MFHFFIIVFCFMAIEQNQVGSPDIPQWMLKAAGIKDLGTLKSLPEERLAKLNDWAVNNSLSYSNAIKNAEYNGLQTLSVRGGSISLNQARERVQHYDQFRAMVMNEAQQRWNRDEYNRAMEKTVTYPAWMLQQNGMRSISSADDDKLAKVKEWAQQNHDVFFTSVKTAIDKNLSEIKVGGKSFTIFEATLRSREYEEFAHQIATEQTVRGKVSESMKQVPATHQSEVEMKSASDLLKDNFERMSMSSRDDSQSMKR